MNTPTLQKRFDASFDDVLAQLPAALKAEGFGVLTEIDIQATLKQKLGVEFRKYRILGACNPRLAHRALSQDLDVGVLLPCNVAIYEADGGGTVVSAIDPLTAIGAVGGDAFEQLSVEVRSGLERVVDALR